MILVNTVLVHCASGFVGSSSSIIGSCCLVELMFFLVCYMWTLSVAIDGGMCLLISLIVKFFNAENDPLLMARMIVFLTGMNSVVWYHRDILGLVPSSIRLFSDWCVGVGRGCGVVISWTCHMKATTLRVLSRTTYPFYLLFCVWHWMWMYSHYHIADKSILVPLIIDGGICVLFCILYTTRDWV